MRQSWLMGAALVLLAVAAPARADEWSKKYSVSGKPELEVTTNDGNVEISSAAQNEIEAHVTTLGWRIPNDVRISESQSGNTVRLDVRVPNTHWSFFGVGHRSLRIQLRIPSEADVDVQTGDGNVTSEPVSGRIHIQTGDGNITASGLKGNVRLHTGDGHVQGQEFDGALDADTGDGNMTVAGRFDALSLKTGDGHVDAEIANGSNITGTWSIRSGDGNINVRLPENVHADLDAHTGDGHISLDFPVTVSGSLSNNSIRGKMNGGGGGLLMLRSGDGSIRLQRL